ncbi:monovalent cation/H+ antiporter complex subunit F [Cellulomonas bogoriensis]|uniref:Cation:proton antiporter n=1 Tax=Cellulomonas bogoriensis 69B4 = DSM 16987 TaxID=1386082 RepID=A0A0A0BKZ0_9CELL|nr:monovalent cation/H+ antiporter complex subunit F [Cellulomonas bogoriensis]KGM08545.1 cation:proton antiporter [Cellulomonas bogoriensis 69B4 = DSM 16987]
MIVAVVVAGAFLTVAAVLALIRVEKGPSMLDRTVALDITTSAIVGAIAVEAAWSRRVDTVPILVAVALVGFVGSVTIARFAAVEPEGEGRILTKEEVAALEAERLAAEDADLAAHDAEHHGGPAQGEVHR